MILIPIFFGVFSLLVGLLMLVRPAVVTAFLSANGGKPFLQTSAVVARLILGVSLILTAAVSKFPILISWLGWLTVVAAIVFAVIRRARFGQLISWALGISQRFGRPGGVIAALFGVFLLYAYL
jgi:hypothetical protein